MTALAWKLNRLRLMGAAEVTWRAGQLLRRKAGTLGLGLARRPPAPAQLRCGAPFLAGAATAAPPAPGHWRGGAGVVSMAEELLAGRWDVFALRGVPLGFPPQWNRDPKTGTVAPLAAGPSIDYRDATLVGDIKYLWEPSRHLELVTLAQAWHATGDRRFADGARKLLLSWLEQCPYPQGVHWASALELGVRLLNWAAAWQLLEEAIDAVWRDRWLSAIYQHCHFIRHHLSRHSSANNHLLGEYAGLFIACLQWPCWPESAQWRALAQRGLEREGLAQNYADGVNKEQAIYYQHEVMDMMLLCQLAAQANGASFSPSWLERLERMAEYLAAMMDAAGNVPMIGDADDARMLRLAPADGTPYRSLLASCALLFGRGDFKAKAGVLDERNRWLFGDADARWAAIPGAPRAAPRMAFPHGGYYLLGRHFNTAREVRIAIDCGALGYLSIAAHGHADALAFTLSMGGEEMLIDPGTFAYHTQRAWRDYFRSTAAHNTVQVDGMDQSEIGGSFMWLRKACAQQIAHIPDGTRQLFEGKQDGYLRLRDPVLHRRIIEFDANRNAVLVKDVLECLGEHEVSLHWHFAEHCRAETVEGTLHIAAQRNALSMRCRFGGGPQLFRASTAPIAGWISRSFDSKAGTTTARWRGTIHGTTTIETEIALLEGASL